MSNLASKCAKCGQTVAGSAPKSFTAWLFRPAECNCDRSLIGVTNTPAPPGAASLPGREDQDATLTGQTIAARYEVLALLGRGGMGTVYKVRDHDSGSILALKVISDRLSDPEAYERRLAQEASAVKALTHRNIVALKGAGKTDQGTPFLVMDFVPGKSLDALMQAEGGVNLDQAIDIFVQIAEALDHAHAKGIVHRDLKPGNILLLEDGSGTYCVKIIDFGIAKICDHPGEDKTKLTQTGELMGSPQYMSPEQCRGDHLDARSDIYSLGCTMYEVLSGRPPFAGENPVRVILKHLSEPPERWTKDGRVDADLQNLVLRCLAKDPADRYQSAALLLHDLRQIEQGKRLWAVRFIGTRQRVRQIIGACIATLLLGFLIVPGYLPKSEHPGAQPEPSHRGGDGG